MEQALPPSGQIATPRRLTPFELHSVYEEGFNLAAIPPEQKAELMRHQFTVEEIINFRGSEFLRKLKAYNHGRVFRNIVGGFADRLAAFLEHFVFFITDQNADRTRARIAACAAVGIDFYF